MQEYIKNIEYFHKLLLNRNYSHRTIDIYTNCLKYFFHTVKKDESIVTENDILDFLLLLQKKDRAPKTINLYKETIKTYFSMIHNKQFSIATKFSKEARKLPIVLSRSDLQKLFDSCSNQKHRLLLMLAYGSGLRISEVRDLKVQDIDFE
jgi:integrase/recombinase XerD